MTQTFRKSIQDVEKASMKQAQIIYKKNPSNTFGILSVVFGGLSIFMIALLFVPLGVLFGVLSLLKRTFPTMALGIIGLLLSILGFLTSPFLMGFLGLGLMGR